jgi:hypothetical protein
MYHPGAEVVVRLALFLLVAGSIAATASVGVGCGSSPYAARTPTPTVVATPVAPGSTSYKARRLKHGAWH